MSTIVKTMTPFINIEILCEALTAVGCRHTVCGDVIIMDGTMQKFELIKGRYSFIYERGGWRDTTDKQYKSVNSFLKSVEKMYNYIYEARLQAERERLERERREYVEKQKQEVIARAKAQGYAVREEKVKEKIKLVLVRSTY